MLTKEIIIQTRRFSYFVFHIQRCKRDEDKIKITMHMTWILSTIPVLKSRINDNAKELLEMIMPKAVE